jgi:hypothetical protein
LSREAFQVSVTLIDVAFASANPDGFVGGDQSLNVCVPS